MNHHRRTHRSHCFLVVCMTSRVDVSQKLTIKPISKYIQIKPYQKPLFASLCLNFPFTLFICMASDVMKNRLEEKLNIESMRREKKRTRTHNSITIG